MKIYTILMAYKGSNVYNNVEDNGYSAPSANYYFDKAAAENDYKVMIRRYGKNHEVKLIEFEANIIH